MQLQWKTDQDRTHYADTPCGVRYSIRKMFSLRVFSLYRDGRLLAQWPTMDSAKDAAQRHLDAQSS